MTEGTCLSQQPIRDAVGSKMAVVGRNRAVAPVNYGATLAGVRSEYRNTSELTNGWWVVFWECVCFFLCLSSSQGGGPEAGGASKRADITVPQFGQLQHITRDWNLWRPLWSTGETFININKCQTLQSSASVMAPKP